MKKQNNKLIKTKQTKKTKKVRCQYCEKKISHMVVILDKKGDIHVHAPFKNSILMGQFLEAIMREQNKYNNKMEMSK